jgi:hypothetical protein
MGCWAEFRGWGGWLDVGLCMRCHRIDCEQCLQVVAFVREKVALVPGSHELGDEEASARRAWQNPVISRRPHRFTMNGQSNDSVLKRPNSTHTKRPSESVYLGTNGFRTFPSVNVGYVSKFKASSVEMEPGGRLSTRVRRVY